MRIVIDTNVVASAIFFGGKPEHLIELLMQQDVDAFVSQDILREYQEKYEKDSVIHSSLRNQSR